MCFAIFIVKSYGYIASLFSMIRYILTCSWQKSIVYYDVLHQKVIITRLCYPVKIWTDLSCSKTWHNLYRMITPHRHVGYALCRYILHYGEGEGYSISLFLFVFFSPYLAYEYELLVMWGQVLTTYRDIPGQTFRCSVSLRFRSSLSSRKSLSSALSLVLSDSSPRTCCNSNTKNKYSTYDTKWRTCNCELL